jgi:hypothetical protein
MSIVLANEGRLEYFYFFFPDYDSILFAIVKDERG